MNPTLALIRQFEGFRETPYWDVNALRTGYGSDTVTLADGTVVPVTKETRVTREDADRDLQRRVETEFGPRAASAVGEEAFASLSPAQQAALVSITYNYGELPSSVAMAVRSGDPQAAANAIRALGSHNDGINKGRRNKEADVFIGAEALPQQSGMEADGPGRTDRNPARLAWAYANGKMSPEDAALYEKGMAEGAFPQAEKSQAPQQPDPMAIYAATAMRPRQPFAPVALTSAPIENATPLRPFGRT